MCGCVRDVQGGGGEGSGIVDLVGGVSLVVVVRVER